MDRMVESMIVVERPGHAVVQDLGRSGYANIGIGANGAADQHSARTGNILVGNGDAAPLIEVTGSELVFTAGSDVLMAVTGAADHVVVDGHRQPGWETLTVFAGSRVSVPSGRTGLRSYVAFNGQLVAEPVLGSVAPDRLLGVGRPLNEGDTLTVRTGYRADHRGSYAPLFRLGAERPGLQSPATIETIPGPDVGRMKLGLRCLPNLYEVSSRSDHIGLRLLGPDIEQLSSDEILSRGVPVGAIEVPPTGGVIALLRGRLVTAGYPVIGVVTSVSLDRLGQVRPGDMIQFTFCALAAARSSLHARERVRQGLAGRVGTAFRAKGLGGVIDPMHRSRATVATAQATIRSPPVPNP